MKTLFPLLIIFTSTLLFSQAPGYMGKRFVVGYGAHVSPAFINANNSNQTILGLNGSAESGSFAFNYTHEGFFEFQAKTRFTVGVSCKFYKTKYDNALSNYAQGQYINYYTSASYSNDVEGYYGISGQSICLYGKLYKTGSVAPLGRYIIFGPVLNLYQATYDPNIMYQRSDYYGSGNNKFSSYGNLTQSFTGFNILFGWGKTRIIKDRVIIDYGANLQLFSTFAPISSILANDNRINDQYISNTASKRIRALNAMNVFLKVGYLF